MYEALEDIVPLSVPEHVPPEVWTMIFKLIRHPQQLLCCLVSRAWCALFTHLTHWYIVLSMPRHRPFSCDDSAFEKCLAFKTEVDMSTMITEYSIEQDVWGIRHINWPIFPHNWFLHLLPCVEIVSFESLGDQFRMGDIPCIPQPYLLPPSVVELNLARVSFLGHSIEGILSPNSNLERLCIDSVDYGGIVCVFGFMYIVL